LKKLIFYSHIPTIKHIMDIIKAVVDSNISEDAKFQVIKLIMKDTTETSETPVNQDPEETKETLVAETTNETKGVEMAKETKGVKMAKETKGTKETIVEKIIRAAPVPPNMMSTRSENNNLLLRFNDETIVITCLNTSNGFHYNIERGTTRANIWKLTDVIVEASVHPTGVSKIVQCYKSEPESEAESKSESESELESKMRRIAYIFRRGTLTLIKIYSSRNLRDRVATFDIEKRTIKFYDTSSTCSVLRSLIRSSLEYTIGSVTMNSDLAFVLGSDVALYINKFIANMSTK
jgi:hypothetical protein